MEPLSAIWKSVICALRFNQDRGDTHFLDMDFDLHANQYKSKEYYYSLDPKWRSRNIK